MEQFATEEQQVEAIKRFWSEHGTSLIVGAVLGLAGLLAGSTTAIHKSPPRKAPLSLTRPHLSRW